MEIGAGRIIHLGQKLFQSRRIAQRQADGEPKFIGGWQSSEWDQISGRCGHMAVERFRACFGGHKRSGYLRID